MGLDTKGFKPVELSPEELAVMREEVHDRVIVARVGLLLRHPFFGNMATRMRVQNCDDWCPTAATDGRNLYYNTQFFNMLSNKQIEFVIAHEILHCVFDHITRREDRDAMVYNIACDYLVNNLLIRDKIGERVDQVQIFQDFKYDGWTSEEVYDDIKEKYDDEQLEALGQLLDEHVDWTKDGDQEGQAPGQSNGKDGKKSKRPTYSKEELKKIRDEIKESMITSAQSAGAGNTPGEIARMIKELTEPKMNWRELLRQQIQSTIKSDFTFSRPSRKGWHTGAILPGMNFMDTIDICIGIDMSGSIGNQQAQDFLGEVKGIMDEYKDYKIKLWCFDTDVYNEEDFSADGGQDLMDYEILGGGGTDFDANWTYMKQNDIQPKKFIMFTDGYPFGSWGDEDYCDTIFVIHSHRDKNLQAPFGMTAHYEESA
jgi:predicted metal-dependent peptidase